MSIPLASSSLFNKASNQSTTAARRQRLEQVVKKFEGVLWGDVAQAMSAVKMGPSSTGYGGKVYQRMMWHKVTQHDFGKTDQTLTRATMNQLMGPRSTTTTLAKTQSSSTSGAKSTAQSHDPQSWVNEIWSAVKAGAKELGVPVKGMLAQAALETGWGSHASANNLFGVKAHGSGSSFSALTHEFTDGVMRQVRSSFQQYGSPDQAIQDFVSVLKSAHSQVVGQQTVSGYAHALQTSGYATDPRYAAKIEAVAESPQMNHLLAMVNK